MATTRLPTDLVVQGNLAVTGSIPTIARSSLEQNTVQLYQIPWEAWRVWDAYQTNLPGTSAEDDLGLYGGTWGTNPPSIQTYDVKAAGALNLYARANISLPPEYDTGQTVQISAHAGMKTTVADNSCTLDFVVYESNKEDGLSADLCTTAATSINSLTMATKTYDVTATSIAPGDLLDIRMHVAVNDAASGTAVIALIGWVGIAIDIKG